MFTNSSFAPLVRATLEANQTPDHGRNWSPTMLRVVMTVYCGLMLRLRVAAWWHRHGDDLELSAGEA